MASINREENTAKRAVDASCEIVIDALYMTSDILHSIKNNLPVPMEHAQVVLGRRVEEAPAPAAELAQPLSPVSPVVSPGRAVTRLILAAVGLAAMMLGAIEMAGAIGSADPAPRGEQGAIIFPTPLEEAREHLKAGDAAAALESVEFARAQGLDGADLRHAHIASLLELGQHEEARAAALRAVADGHGADFVTHYRTTLYNDPQLTAPATLLPAGQLDRSRQDGDRVIVLMDGVDYTLDVARPDNSAWAAQLSAARLCTVLACSFDVPRVEHRLLDRAATTRLGLDPESLSWRYTDSPEGERIEVVDAALTERVEAPTGFPIEYTRTWRNLLSASVDEDHVAAPFVANLEPLSSDWTRKVVSQRGDVDSREFGRQVGSMLAFDFLTNNFDRFERDERRYGANVGWLNGSLLSADHRNVFKDRQSRRVRDRFRWMTRMPAETATAVRLMSPEFVDTHVLVGLSDRQREIFWAQHGEFVERVDALEQKHGRSHVLAL